MTAFDLNFHVWACRVSTYGRHYTYHDAKSHSYRAGIKNSISGVLSYSYAYTLAAAIIASVAADVVTDAIAATVIVAVNIAVTRTSVMTIGLSRKYQLH